MYAELEYQAELRFENNPPWWHNQDDDEQWERIW
jgi:hypothetical protein